MKFASKLCCVVAGLICNSAIADWQLDNESSQLNFLSTKKSQITELHKFNTLSGSISELGKVSVEIDLSSVDTKIPVRDDRMQQYLFEVEKFATATISAQLEPSFLQSMDLGSSHNLSLNAELDLHGQTQSLPIEVTVFKDKSGKVSAISRQPVIINAADFELVKGINKLQELAGLPSITHVVPVTFSLTFSQ